MTRVEKVMKILAEDIGVEFEEAFKVEEYDKCLEFHIDKGGIFENNTEYDETWGFVDTETFVEILEGDLITILTWDKEGLKWTGKKK